MSVFKWRIRCVTEGVYRYVWSDVEPTECPFDSGHTIDASKTSIVGSSAAEEVVGGLVVLPLSTPATPSVEAKGTPGSTIWAYRVSAKNSQGETLASVESQISNGAAILNATDFNRVTWEEVANATEYVVYRSTTGGTPSTLGKIAATINNQLDDTGLAAAGSEPTEDLSGALAVGSGMMAVSRILHVRERTYDKETVTSIAHASRETPNDVEAGFGTGFLVSLQDADDTTPLMRSAGALHVLWDDPDPAELKTILRLMVRNGSLPFVKAAQFTAAGSEIDGIPYAAKALELVERKVVSGSAVEEVEFTGLDGDVDRVYQILARIKNADSVARTFYLRPNDLGTNVDSSRVDWDGATVASSGSTYLRICSSGAGEWMLADVLFYAKTGAYRMMRSLEAYSSGDDGEGAVHGGIWTDTTTKVTSLVIKGSAVGTIAVGSEFSLYRVL